MAREKHTPSSEAEVRELIADADAPLSVQGGGTRGFAGAGEVLSVSGLSGVTLYEPGALTMVARAGTPISEIEGALGQNNQRLAFEPMDHRTLLGVQGDPTIGGVFGANVSGPRRIAVGAARDFLLGVRFVDGSGAVVKNGGRVMKNVTGYDLVKLMAGSFGTLGVMTEVSFKVLPQPETQTTLVLHGLDIGAGVAAMSQALGTPFEVTGAAHDPNGAGDGARTMLRLEGFEGSVGYRCGALRDRLAHGADISVLEGEESETAWRKVRDVEMLAETQGDVWRISCKPSDAPHLIARTGSDQLQLDWGGGLIWMQVPEGHDLRADLGDFDGHATLVRADAKTKTELAVFQPEAAGVARLTAGLRSRFDPRGILNAGLMEPIG
ncbi:FAD-binding protein [Sulfitobacter aestuariivivens]|uniref:FAD-binding protein n=1 Tax=Sulfitobacter aestuariivivens TaxID=2766981 RepID=A0A927D4B5_9RHOB|nr:FAD-binding protein [Sulfitobacter aestuariivivens]MBD3664878.1 FAD-binding protein [Sulfitobacter aestuariivivens]